MSHRAYLFSLEQIGIKLGLDQIRALKDAVEVQRRLDAIRQELCLPLLPRREGQCSGQTRKSVACPAAARRHN